jgi:hypothetical protein
MVYAKEKVLVEQAGMVSRNNSTAVSATTADNGTTTRTTIAAENGSARNTILGNTSPIGMVVIAIDSIIGAVIIRSGITRLATTKGITISAKIILIQ